MNVSLSIKDYFTFCPRQTEHERNIVVHAMQVMTSLLMPYGACAEIGHSCFLPEVIGNFPEAEARQFFIDEALPCFEPEMELSKDDWTKVWEVWADARIRIHLNILVVLLHTSCFCPIVRSMHNFNRAAMRESTFDVHLCACRSVAAMQGSSCRQPRLTREIGMKVRLSLLHLPPYLMLLP